METGAITLLDVMGWKGIWQRNKNAQQALRELQENTRAVADLVTQGTVDVFEVFKGLNVRLQGISEPSPYIRTPMSRRGLLRIIAQ